MASAGKSGATVERQSTADAGDRVLVGTARPAAVCLAAISHATAHCALAARRPVVQNLLAPLAAAVPNAESGRVPRNLRAEVSVVELLLAQELVRRLTAVVDNHTPS